ncbi:MAG TPA: signal peptidase I [Bellilinea sp.]|nr:signal peptidase I [Bellilinea sp.]
MIDDYQEIQTDEVVPTKQPEISPKTTFGSLLSEVFKTLLLALVLYFAISAVTDRVRVENVSMQPTLYEGELLVVSKLAYQFGEPHRGDIIVFHHNPDPPEDYIKRVIGLPGDTVTVFKGQVSVNDQLLNEPYLASLPAYEGVWEVPEDMLFVLGDNRNRSSDSHIWGFVPMESVVGRAVVIYWPLSSVRILSHDDIAQAYP